MLLPIGTTVLFLFARVFALLNDVFAASILDGVALALCILWCLSLILLVLCAVFVLLQEEPEESPHAYFSEEIQKLSEK